MVSDPSFRNITLIGMPGAGKSTVGVLLAKLCALAFTDTDLLIQTGEGQRLEQIIRRLGIEGFCDLEARYLSALPDGAGVVATGGSVVYRPKGMARLKTLGPVVYLDVPPVVLARRLGDLDQRGVIHAPGQSIADLHRERDPLYRHFADRVIDCGDLSPEPVALRIMAELPPGFEF
ncbi:MAG: shikimate kinase [Desulfobacterales bacterium]|jgi:shikimate kinase|nr:shikimate kinase [Desulfobacteraceae bacterium]MDD3992635.1 shikimate kinase [Desulfobacteraceae bacterium]MDY0312638.1 shikimate kinase [Desulfobacterales bacterium]